MGLQTSSPLRPLLTCSQENRTKPHQPSQAGDSQKHDLSLVKHSQFSYLLSCWLPTWRESDPSETNCSTLHDQKAARKSAPPTRIKCLQFLEAWRPGGLGGLEALEALEAWRPGGLDAESFNGFELSTDPIHLLKIKQAINFTDFTFCDFYFGQLSFLSKSLSLSYLIIIIIII